MSSTVEWILTIFQILDSAPSAQTNAVRQSTSYWLTEDQSIVEMRMCGDELCGFLASDVDTGDPKISSCGLPILLGLKAGSARQWGGGWIVDPDTGWAFNARAKFKKNGKLKITAFEESEFFSESMKWLPATKESASCYNKKSKKKK